MIFYIIAFTTVLYARCDNLGWKRLALVVSIAPPLAVVYREYYYGGDASLIIMAYIISVFVILGGRCLVLWIKEGFSSSPN